VVTAMLLTEPLNIPLPSQALIIRCVIRVRTSDTFMNSLPKSTPITPARAVEARKLSRSKVKVTRKFLLPAPIIAAAPIFTRMVLLVLLSVLNRRVSSQSEEGMRGLPLRSRANFESASGSCGDGSISKEPQNHVVSRHQRCHIVHNTIKQNKTARGLHV